ncbi:MAG: hypothetical protein CMP76_12265 [Flavobacterium sp.]|nr:hypothetical protein [Flavobacterium sp.]|tara:strand:+ start:1793 stop:2023 length:231 start_codon:yes stop_codon:yes gene_type:complete
MRKFYKKKFRIISFYEIMNLKTTSCQYYYRDKKGNTRKITQQRFKTALQNAVSKTRIDKITPLERIIKLRLKFLIK